MKFLTDEKLVIVGAAGMIGSNMVQTAAMLHLLPNCKVHVIPSGCCGMAGSFGYEKEHYRTSLAIGEMVLFPAVRRAMRLHEMQPSTPTLVAAPGTSCRQQILDGTGVHALHPIEIMYHWLADSDKA